MFRHRFARILDRLVTGVASAQGATPREATALGAAAIAAALAAAIGLVVLVGWYAALPALVHVRPPFVGMQFNTAVTFVLIGTALIAATRGSFRLATTLALLGALLGIANLIEIFADRDFGIDQMLWQLGVDRAAMEPLAIAKTSSPGRMAPNTALGFTLAGLAIPLIVNPARTRIVPATIASAQGVLVLGIGLVAMLGYVGGPPSAFGWGGLTRMAANTALAMTLLGIAVTALAAARLEGAGVAFLDRLPWLVGSAGMIVTAGLTQAYADQGYANVEREIQHSAAHVRSEIALHVDALLMRIERMAKRWEYSPRARDAWEYEAALNLRGLGGFEAIAFLDSLGRTRWVVPASAATSSRAMIAPTVPQMRDVLAIARGRRALTISRALRMPDGDWATLAVAPLQAHGRHDGYIVGVVSIRQALDALIPEGVLSEFRLVVLDGADEIYDSASSATHVSTAHGATTGIDVRGRSWQFRIWPHATTLAALQSRAPVLAAVGGLLLTTLVVLVTVLARRSQLRQLEKLAANERLKEAAAEHRRAVELTAINERLVAEIAERDRARNAARAAEDRYRALVHGLGIGVVMETAEGIVAANPSAERIFGRPIEQLLGLSTADAIWRAVREDGSSFPTASHPVRRALDSGESSSNVIMGVQRADATTAWIELNVRPLVRDGETTPYAAVASFIDHTERKRLEGQLLQAQKMEAIGKLAGGVAHDFNNMLTVITGYTAMLIDGQDRSSPDRADLEEIKRAAERAATLTRQLLAFSRKQILQPRLLDLNLEVVAGLEKMLRRLIREDIELVTSLDDRIGFVHADPGQLEQVIVNLAVNARDSMPNGGRLTIQTAPAELGSDRAGRHFGVPAGQYVMLAVSDTGMGMTRETMARMFEPFFTTKDAGKGTGLGLSTVYGIVKQSGGDIWVYSEPGEGTTFKIYLPVATASAVEAPLPAVSPVVEAGSETVLLVEDDDTLRSLSRRILEARGYTVLESSNGEDALALCERYERRIDLVATDVVMPGMNGRMLIDRLTARRPALRVLFMSGYTDDDILRRGIVDPRTAFIQKPFTPEALANKVREVLDAPRSTAIPSLPPPRSPDPVSR